MRLSTLLSLLILAGCMPQDQPTATDPVIQTVRLIQAGGAIASDTRRFVGRLEARSSVDLAFQVAGEINDLPVNEGARVAKGERIASLDPGDFALALERARASLALARAEHDRARDLLARSAVSQSRVDEVVADLKLAEIAVETAKRNQRLTEIKAPFDALIARRLVDAFSYVTPGTPVVRVQDVTELRVRISVPESLIWLARYPDRFEARGYLAALPETGFDLALREFVTEADPVAQTYEVSFALTETEDSRPLPGMTATVELRLRDPALMAHSGAVSVPLTAIDPNGPTGFQIWVHDEATGTVSPRPVSVGFPMGDQIPVLSGLQQGEVLVATGVGRLSPGLPVRPFEP